MDSLKQRLIQTAKAAGADIVGIAGIDRFDGVAPNHHPLSIYPETRSVIVMAKRLVRGALRGVEEGTQFSSYGSYGYGWLDQFLALAIFQTAAFLEDNHWEAVPVMNLPTEMPAMGIPVAEGKPAPNVTIDCQDAAVRAGLGEIGFCGLLLTPQYGPRQSLQVLLTAAELEPDPILQDPICDQCMDCVNSCPLGAMEAGKSHTLEICGKVMKVADVNYARCASCQNGARPNKHHRSGPPDRLAAICMRSCVDHLGRQGLIQDVPRQPFRRREAWSLTPETVWGLDERRHIE